MRQSEIKFVQFPHSYGEHYVSRSAIADSKEYIFEWRHLHQSHARKFMKSKGQLVEDRRLSEPTDLLFWGEREADSLYTELPQGAQGDSPKWLHEPFLDRNKQNVVPKDNAESGCNNDGFCNDRAQRVKIKAGVPYTLQNTDPLVFGDCFLYSLCRQFMHKPKSKDDYEQRQMAKLAPGSVILFDSRLPETKGGPCFLLDAVFVVGDYMKFRTGEHYPENLNGFVPEDYFDIMHFENYQKINVELTCYKGVTYEQSLDPDYPINGMYSFVPCRPYKSGEGFERPCLYANRFDDIVKAPAITDNLCRNVKGTVVTEEQARRFWVRVCEIINEQGFEKGVNLKYELK